MDYDAAEGTREPTVPTVSETLFYTLYDVRLPRNRQPRSRAAQVGGAGLGRRPSAGRAIAKTAVGDPLRVTERRQYRSKPRKSCASRTDRRSRRPSRRAAARLCYICGGFEDKGRFEQTAHLHCRILEHGTAGLGVCRRASHGEV